MISGKITPLKRVFIISQAVKAFLGLALIAYEFSFMPHFKADWFFSVIIHSFAFLFLQLIGLAASFVKGLKTMSGLYAFYGIAAIAHYLYAWYTFLEDINGPGSGHGLDNLMGTVRIVYQASFWATLGLDAVAMVLGGLILKRSHE